jgi:uncharacterized protein
LAGNSFNAAASIANRQRGVAELGIVRSGLPAPVLDERNEPFIQGALEGKLLLPVCRNCGLRMAPPVANCWRCLADDFDWRATAGTGVIFSFIEYHRAWVKSFSPYLPYQVAIIELTEGIRLVSNVLADAESPISVGARVKVAFEPRDSLAVPVFVLAEESAESAAG